MISVTLWFRFFLSLAACLFGVWLVLRTEQTIKSRGRRALEVSPALVGSRLGKVKVLEVDELEGALTLPVQPNIQYLGPLTQDLDVGEYNVHGVTSLRADRIKGVISTSAQPVITAVSTLKGDLQMSGYDVQNVDRLVSIFLVGVLLDPVQHGMTSVGPLHVDLQMNGQALLGVNVLPGLFSGVLSDGTLSQLTEIGALEANIDVNGQDLHVYEVVRDFTYDLGDAWTWGQASGDSSSDMEYGADPLSYSVVLGRHTIFSTIYPDTTIYLTWSSTDQVNGTYYTCLTPGYYSLSAHIAVNETQATEAGWMLNGGNPNVLPSQQPDYMLGLESTPATGLSAGRIRALPTVVRYFHANESITLLVANSNGTRAELKWVLYWKVRFCFLF